MITKSTFLFKLSCNSTLVLLALVFGNATANASTGSTSVAGGTLSWTAQQIGGTSTCGYSTYTVYQYSGFSITISGTSYPLNGGTAYIYSPSGNGSCPPNGAQPASGVQLTGGNGCKITFIPSGSNSGNASGVCTTDVQGYINPKYVVVGVTYAPPGPNSFVSYTNSKGVATTNTISNSFSSSSTFSVSIGASYGIGAWKGGTQVGSSNTASQSKKDSKSVTLSWAVADAVTTFGTPASIVNGAYTSPVDSDYDIVYVWLNPVEILTLSTSGNVTWNGYGYDANDQNGLDIIGIPVGYLNGDFGPMPQEYLNYTNRTWAAGQVFAAGQSAALNATDFAQIAKFDPFSNSSYGLNQIGYIPPVPNTADGRYSLTTCNSGNSVPFNQSSPSQTPGTYTCTLNYSSLSTTSQALSTSNSNTFSIDQSFSGGLFFAKLTIDLKYSNTVTTTTEADSSISQSQASAALASISGLSCNNSVPYLGPCVPSYNGPIEFDIYSDNLWGTFMFAPVHYF